MTTTEETEGEVWMNPNKGTMFIKTYDHQNRLVDTAIRAGKRVTISEKERLINQDMAASKELDMFSNGTLQPVRLVEDSVDYASNIQNPERISESDIADLFKLKVTDFKKRVGEITNKGTLSRIQEVANLEETNATKGQLNAIDERIEAFKPPRKALSAEELENDRGIYFKPVMPR